MNDSFNNELSGQIQTANVPESDPFLTYRSPLVTDKSAPLKDQGVPSIAQTSYPAPFDPSALDYWGQTNLKRYANDGANLTMQDIDKNQLGVNLTLPEIERNQLGALQEIKANYYDLHNLGHAFPFFAPEGVRQDDLSMLNSLYIATKAAQSSSDDIEAAQRSVYEVTAENHVAPLSALSGFVLGSIGVSRFLPKVPWLVTGVACAVGFGLLGTQLGIKVGDADYDDDKSRIRRLLKNTGGLSY